MGNDQPGVRHIRFDPPHLRRDVLVRQAMEPVAPHTLRSICARQSERANNRRLALVERCIETGDLRQRRCLLKDCADGSKIVRLVEWGRRNQTFELSYCIHINAEREAIFHSTMYDAMADGDNLAANEPCVDGVYDLPGRLLVAEAIGRPHPFGNSGSRSIADFEARFEPDALDLAAEE